MSHEQHHRVTRGRQRLRTTEQQRQAKSRSNGGRAARARAQHPAPAWDADKAIAGLKVIFDELDERDAQ
jgi:hypothetical protein